MHHHAVPGPVGILPHVVRMDGQNSVSAGIVRPECRCGGASCGADPGVGSRLLLGDMPVGRDAGLHIMAERSPQKEEIPILVFSGQEFVALHCARPVHNRHDCGRRLVRGTAGTLQLVRPHRVEPARSGV